MQTAPLVRLLIDHLLIRAISKLMHSDRANLSL